MARLARSIDGQPGSGWVVSVPFLFHGRPLGPATAHAWGVSKSVVCQGRGVRVSVQRFLDARQRGATLLRAGCVAAAGLEAGLPLCRRLDVLFITVKFRPETNGSPIKYFSWCLWLRRGMDFDKIITHFVDAAVDARLGSYLRSIPDSDNGMNNLESEVGKHRQSELTWAGAEHGPYCRVCVAYSVRRREAAVNGCRTQQTTAAEVFVCSTCA